MNQSLDGSTTRVAPRQAHWLGVTLDHLRPIRVPLLVVAAGAACVFGVPQVQEVLRLCLEDDRRGFHWYLALVVAGTVLGASVWYAIRNAYRMRFTRWPSLASPQGTVLRVWLPRLLGAGVPLLLALGLFVSWNAVSHTASDVSLKRLALHAAPLLAISGALLAFFILRVPLTNRMLKRVGTMTLPGSHQPPHHDRIRELGAFPLALLALTVIGNLVVLALVLNDPLALDFLGPPAVVLLAGLFFCISGGFLTLFGDLRGLPVLMPLIGIGALLHGIGVNDNHLVRQHAGMTTYAASDPPVPAPPRARFTDHLDAWWKVRCADAAPCTVVLVSAEGGGIRAAAWTHIVLSELDARSGGRFSQRWLAGSGVSGGSLGLVARVLERDAGVAPTGDAAIAFHASDFLSPVLANLFFVDLVTQRLWPQPAFDDRGRALTRAWHAAALRSLGSEALEQPFSALYARADGTLDIGRPLLLLNATDVATGARVIQHGFDQLPELESGAWPGAIDGAGLLGPAAPLSEAVLNSARFSYASPAGNVTAVDPPRQLVDGGYFENSGTTTLYDLVRVLRSRFGQNLRAHVVHISNEPTAVPFARGGAGAVDDTCRVSTAAPAQLRGDATAPVAALLATREARGDLARRLLQASLGPDDRLWHLRLCDRGRPLPLGWTISEAALGDMREQASERLTSEVVDAIAGAAPP